VKVEPPGVRDPYSSAQVQSAIVTLNLESEGSERHPIQREMLDADLCGPGEVKCLTWAFCL